MSDPVQVVIDAAGKWRDELTDYIEPDAAKRGADAEAEGYESEADQIDTAINALQVMHVYFTGDEEGPNRFGTVYDTEDEALECAFENDLVIWRVPVIPNWVKSERVGPDVEDSDA